MFNFDPCRKYYGKYKGIIKDTNDPEKRGRIRVHCPQVMGEKDDKSHWLDWAEPCFPWLGGLSSLDFGVPPLPVDNDGENVGVWIEFEDGNPDFPIWSGVYIYAPTVDGKHSQVDQAAVKSSPGGTLMSYVASGETTGSEDDSVADFNPITPMAGKEIRLVAKAGVDIVIMSDRGGAIVVGPYGVQIQGVFVRANGRLIEADVGKISG